MTRQQRHDLIALGEAIRERRMQRHLSASALASASGLPLGRLAALEAGRLDPNIELLHTLAESMGTSRSVLCRRAEELEAGGGGGREGTTEPEAPRRWRNGRDT